MRCEHGPVLPAVGFNPRVEAGIAKYGPAAMARSCFANDGFFCFNVAA
jgi:hypothetical protein